MILLNSIYIYFIYRAAALGKFILNILKLLFFCIQLANRFLADFAIFYEDLMVGLVYSSQSGIPIQLIWMRLPSSASKLCGA